MFVHIGDTEDKNKALFLLTSFMAKKEQLPTIYEEFEVY